MPVRATFKQVQEDLEGPVVKSIARFGRMALKVLPKETAES